MFIWNDIMIKVIIFDLGGVIDDSGRFFGISEILSKKTGGDPDEIHGKIRENWKRARVDSFGCDYFWKNIAEFVGMDIDELKKEFYSVKKIRPEMIRLIATLRKRYKVVLLSNFIKDWFEWLDNKYNLHEKFDLVTTSYEAGAAKPDEKIFTVVMERLGVRPEECIFIDDQLKNDAESYLLGMKVIVFENVDQMKSELEVYLEESI